MTKKNRYGHRPPPRRRRPAAEEVVRAAPRVFEKKTPVEYGRSFVLLEDKDKNTFAFQDGAWVQHEMSIAQCRQDCQVKELSQKINGMTRFEIRAPLTAKA